MKTNFKFSFLALAVILISSCHNIKEKESEEETENEENEAKFSEQRIRYEFDMLKDPATGKIPYGIEAAELAQAKTIPVRDYGTVSRVTDLNTYLPAGPNNAGGRTRALAYDVRYNGSTNKVIIAGSVSSGIMRTTDGGVTWTRVSPDGEIHNITCIAQDPRAGNQNTWYAGGGEYLGNSADAGGAAFMGYGVFKSIDNGATWTKLTMNVTDINGTTVLGAGTLEGFDNPFDYVHKMIVNPANGHLYIAGHRRIIRSTDGGSSFNVIFGGAVGAFAANGQADIACSSTGKLVLAISGSNPDLTLRGVWTSTTGNAGSWTRIAGGSTLGIDSVANWRANAYTFTVVSGSNFYDGRRIVLSMAPSNNNIVYVMYENGISNTAGPEADLYKLDMTAGNVWTNLSANMPDFPGSHTATDPFTIQGGYDMIVSVKPNDPNFVVVGGTSLYKSTDGFATTANTSWIGGYGFTLPTLTIYPNSHPDIHAFVFNPSDPTQGLCGNDGGIQLSTNFTTAASGGATWANVSNYQTLQYYAIAIDPGSGRNNFVGGAQDNGTYFRDKTGILGTAAPDSNNHTQIRGGDGCAVAMGALNGSTQFAFASTQSGSIRRIQLTATLPGTTITPSGLTSDGSGGFGEFVTNFRADPDNSEDLYYVNFNRLFRTTNSSTVTSSGWTELNGVSQSVNPTNPTGGTNIGIRAMAFSRGPYATSHAMYIGTTNGKIWRIDDPRNATSATIPVEITPATLTGNVQNIAVNPNNDDEVMAVVTNYGVVGVWWTTNAKAAVPTWKNVEGNLTLPSFRSCAIIVKKDASNNPVTEYYVGTSVGLYSCTNLNAATPNWQREGGSVLNFAIVGSIAYRPSDNILLLGTHGNGMYYSFLGTPNFTPNLNTGVTPVTNDKNFISKVYPTVTNAVVNFTTGNILSIKKINVQVFTTTGQETFRSTMSYSSGNIDISKLAKGAYIINITSDDKKYRHVQQIIKQ